LPHGTCGAAPDRNPRVGYFFTLGRCQGARWFVRIATPTILSGANIARNSTLNTWNV